MERFIYIMAMSLPERPFLPSAGPGSLAHRKLKNVLDIGWPRLFHVEESRRRDPGFNPKGRAVDRSTRATALPKAEEVGQQGEVVIKRSEWRLASEAIEERTG